VHLRYSNGQAAKINIGNDSLAKENDIEIPKLLETFKSNSAFEDFFVDDFLNRGKKTCDKIVADKYDDMGSFISTYEGVSAFNLKDKLDLSEALLPNCLIFFTK
jgi:hypothetical protein